MSRIISKNYTNRISSLINSYSIPLNLSKTIEFFLIEIKKDLSSSENRNRKIFSESDFERVCNIKDSKSLSVLFSYLNILIESFEGAHLHVHVNNELTDSYVENIQTLFYWDLKVKDSYNINYLEKNLNNLVTKSKLPIKLGLGNRHEENRLRRERKGIKHKIKIIEFLLKKEPIFNHRGILFNVNKGSFNNIFISEFSEFSSSLNTYFNFGESLQSIYDNNNTILSRVDTIINLFPAITGSNIWYNDFIAENINEWNRLGEFNFNKVITITSGAKTPESISDMLKQNKFQAEEIYIIYPFELDYEDYEN